MEIEAREYSVGNTACHGKVVYDKSITDRRPGILVAHAWKGQDQFAIEKAQALAELGYVAMAIDLYGNGTTASTAEAALALMKPLFIDRHLLRQRIVAAYESLKAHPLVDSSRIGAIGFCFGGLVVVELLRSGVELRGVAAFHGLVGNQLGDIKAVEAPSAPKLHGAFLAFHGYEDPLLSPADIAAFQLELNRKEVDWQWHTYGHTTHAFTNPAENSPELGMAYNPRADKRSWLEMKNFFCEIFS
jgi:dienelactone hydrolase